MKVAVTTNTEGFSYKLTLDEDDRKQGRYSFVDHTEEMAVHLVNDSWSVLLPPTFTRLHPDAHAASILLVLHPFIGSVLDLPFQVSSAFSTWIRQRTGISLPNMSEDLEPRRFPTNPTPSLLFSGGVDSLAATRYLPKDTEILFWDRVAHLDAEHLGNPNLVIDQVHQRALCDRLEQSGHRLHRVIDDHELLFAPYPTWHSGMYILPALYLCDSLNLGFVETGDVMGVCYFQGYLDAASPTKSWSFTPDKWAPDHRGPQPAAFGDLQGLFNSMDLLNATAMVKVTSTFGLSEVATARIVHDSPYRGMGASCYYSSETNYCMKCDKCFKKLLLDRVFSDTEVEPRFIDEFFRHPQVRDVFQGPFLQWHHIWYYIFQRIRCEHPWIKAVQSQAVAGPDLGMLERWYPGAARHIPEQYREEVIANITSLVQRMTPEEVTALETLSIPGLEVSPWQVPGPEEVVLPDKAPEPEQKPDPLTLELERTLKAAAYYMGGTIRGWSPTSVTCHAPAMTRRTIIFTRGKELFILEVEELSHQGRYFTRTDRFGISHQEQTPPISDDHMVLIQLLKKVLSKSERRKVQQKLK